MLRGVLFDAFFFWMTPFACGRWCWMISEFNALFWCCASSAGCSSGQDITLATGPFERCGLGTDTTLEEIQSLVCMLWALLHPFSLLYLWWTERPLPYLTGVEKVILNCNRMYQKKSWRNYTLHFWTIEICSECSYNQLFAFKVYFVVLDWALRGQVMYFVSPGSFAYHSVIMWCSW